MQAQKIDLQGYGEPRLSANVSHGPDQLSSRASKNACGRISLVEQKNSSLDTKPAAQNSMSKSNFGPGGITVAKLDRTMNGL